jgi:hypothetical protein
MEYNETMWDINDDDIIITSRKYGIRPGTLKCAVFACFDKGLDYSEARFKVRGHPRACRCKTFNNTIRRYCSLWESLQNPYPTKQGKAKGKEKA